MGPGPGLGAEPGTGPGPAFGPGVAAFAAADPGAGAAAFSAVAGVPYTGSLEKKNLMPFKINMGFVRTTFAMCLRSDGSTKALTVQLTGSTTCMTMSSLIGSAAPSLGVSSVDGTTSVVSIFATLAVSNVLPKPVDRMNILAPLLVYLVHLVRKPVRPNDKID